MKQLPGDRLSAMTYTFDDGTVDQYHMAAPILEEYGFRGTFFIMPGMTEEQPHEVQLPSQYKGEDGTERTVMGWKQLRDLHSRGHEIANHGWDHLRLEKVTHPATLKLQIGRSAKTIAKEIGVKPASWAWPYYRAGLTKLSMALVSEHHKLIRRTHPLLSLGDTMTPSRAAGWVQKALDCGGWWVSVVHMIAKDGTHKKATVEEHVFRASLERAREVQNKLWVCTMRDLAKFIDRPLQ